MRRAGADILITYSARDAAQWLVTREAARPQAEVPG
jgi:hypothetical protein